MQDASERENVRAGVGGSAADLLGRHVVNGPEYRPRPRVECHGRSVSLSLGRYACAYRHHSRQAEIEDLHQPVGGKKNVLRLEVAVDDPLGVGGRQTVGHRHTVLHSLSPRNRRPAHALPKCLTLQQFHDDIGNALLRPDVVNSQDVRVRKSGDGFGLALKPRQRLGVARGRIRKHLDGHLTLETRVLRAIDLAHAARAERSDNLIRAQVCTGR